jgi:hypothetical protein
VEVKFYIFSTLAQDVSDQLHAMAALHLRERASNNHGTGPRDNLDMTAERNVPTPNALFRFYTSTVQFFCTTEVI